MNPLKGTNPSPNSQPLRLVQKQDRKLQENRREREREKAREKKRDPEKTTYYSRSSRSVCQRRRLGAQKQKGRGYNPGSRCWVSSVTRSYAPDAAPHCPGEEKPADGQTGEDLASRAQHHPKSQQPRAPNSLGADCSAAS